MPEKALEYIKKNAAKYLVDVTKLFQFLKDSGFFHCLFSCQNLVHDKNNKGEKIILSTGKILHIGCKKSWSYGGKR